LVAFPAALSLSQAERKRESAAGREWKEGRKEGRRKKRKKKRRRRRVQNSWGPN
jgi:hypothetical protein